MAEPGAPRWRTDFPFTSEGEEEVTRREFARIGFVFDDEQAHRK